MPDFMSERPALPVWRRCFVDEKERGLPRWPLACGIELPRVERAEHHDPARGLDDLHQVADRPVGQPPVGSNESSDSTRRVVLIDVQPRESEGGLDFYALEEPLDLHPQHV